MVGFDFLSPLLEFTAAILGFIYVYLIATEKSVGWFFGIISAFLYALFFYRMHTWGLFSQQIAYFILIILIVFIGYMIYLSKLQNNECDFMNNLYSTVNGNISSIN